MPSIDLKQSALRLVELGRLIVRAYIEWDSEKIAQLATEFAETKRLVQIHLIENPAVQLPGADAAEARAVLRKIASGEPLPAEEALIGKIVDCGFDTVDFDEIGTDELYSWMSHIDYAEGLYQAGALIVACGTLPKELSTYVNEARQCFAFQQYNAVFALCRTIIEIAIKDIAIARHILPQDHENIVHIISRGGKSLAQLITEVTMTPELSHLKDRLHKLRISTNSIVHGSASVTKSEALDTLKLTLHSVHELYEAAGSGA